MINGFGWSSIYDSSYSSKSVLLYWFVFLWFSSTRLTSGLVVSARLTFDWVTISDVLLKVEVDVVNSGFNFENVKSWVFDLSKLWFCLFENVKSRFFEWSNVWFFAFEKVNSWFCEFSNVAFFAFENVKSASVLIDVLNSNWPREFEFEPNERPKNEWSLRRKSKKLKIDNWSKIEKNWKFVSKIK